MSTTIRNSVNSKVKDQIDFLLEFALIWMKDKYESVNFDNIDFIFSNSFSRARYFRNTNNDRYPNPVVCISTRSTLYLYNKPSLGMKKTTCFVGSDIQILSALIHELTHHIQYETGLRIGNETDTTKNELLFLQQYSIDDYNEIINN